MALSCFRNRLAGMVGNLLEHYDQALFGLLAPFIAPLFFQEKDPLTALILTYGMLSLGFITRPLGSLFFGWIGDRFGRREALFCSLSGMAAATIGIGCLPLYHQIGSWAPLLLGLGRMFQGFFAAGESVGGAIFVLEQTSERKRGFVSSCYDASSIGGILLASGLVAFMSAQGMVEQHWRTLFWLGGATAVFGVFLRLSADPATDIPKAPYFPLFRTLKEYRFPLLAMIFSSGFSYATYSLAFTFMNGYVPLISSLSKTEAMQINTILLIADFLLLPCFGFLATQWGKERVMLAGACSCALLAIPLFSLLEGASLAIVAAVRIAIMLGGVAFAAPYYAWAMEQVPARCRYLTLSLGSALGSQVIGAPTSAVSLWLYKTLGWSWAPGFYLLVAASGAAFAVFHSLRKKKPILE